MLALRSAIVLIAMAALTLSTVNSVQAAWSGEATLDTPLIHFNFLERLRVSVLNSGPGDIEVRSVSLTINWNGNPTLYQIFKGTTMIAAGESKEFVSEQTRMPDESEGTYRCFITVTAIGTDGLVTERRFSSTIGAAPFSLSAWGIPEAIMIPTALTLIPLLITLVFFHLQRAPRWPFLHAIPRLVYHHSRRT